MSSDIDLMWYYIGIIREDIPNTSAERIQYVHNVNKCIIVINTLYVEDNDYLYNYMHDLLKQNNFQAGKLIIGSDHSKSLNKSQCIKIKNLYSNKCVICDFPISGLLEVHHIIPKNLCGKNTESNLIAVCPTCHSIFHDIEQRGCITQELKEYLIEHNQLEKISEYTCHLIYDRMGNIIRCKR